MDFSRQFFKYLFGILLLVDVVAIFSNQLCAADYSGKGNPIPVAPSNPTREYPATSTSRSVQDLKRQAPSDNDVKRQIPKDFGPNLGADPSLGAGDSGSYIGPVPTDKSGVPLKPDSDPNKTNGSRVSYYYEHFYDGTSSMLTISFRSDSDPRAVHFNLQDNTLEIPDVSAEEKVAKTSDDEGYGINKITITISDRATGVTRIIEYHGSDLQDFKLNIEVPNKGRVTFDPGFGCDQRIHINGDPVCTAKYFHPKDQF